MADVKADDVVGRYARKKVDLSLRLLECEGGAKPLVLIEGGPDALKMLGALLVAVADDKDKFSISPDGAGSVPLTKNFTARCLTRRQPTSRPWRAPKG